jgi:hypothetical protein
MKSQLTVAALALIFLVCKVSSQVQTPARVGAFGGIQKPLAPLDVPSELKPFVPKGFVLRALLQTKLSPKGETLVLYDNDDDVFPEVHLHAVGNGTEMKLFDGVVAGVAGLLPIEAKEHQGLVVFAYHVGADLADTTFVIFKRETNSFRKIFVQQTSSGQMRMLSKAPVTFEIWSADYSLDGKESCVWCAHRYRVQTYVGRTNDFALIAERTTPEAISPGDIVQNAFVVSDLAAESHK